MAILRDVPGIQVTVQVAGNDAIEYEDPDASEGGETRDATCPTSIKYIECVDEAEFAIKLRVDDTYQWGHKNNALMTHLRLDGKSVSGIIVSQTARVNGTAIGINKGEYAYCTQTDRWLFRKFKFSAVDVVDDSNKSRVEKDVKIARHLGLIQVKVFRCIPLGTYRKPTPRSDFQQSDKLELAEKSLKGKAISHGTSFSSGQHTRTPNNRRVAYIDGYDKPIAMFQFHYRSREALKREMVIPRSPSPAPEPKCEIAQMSRAELERLARERLDQLQNDQSIKEERKPMVKNEVGGTIDLTEEIKRPIKSSRRVRVAPNEVIDLTDD
ncbi:uncharacterized protein F4812DRAFT_470407 [Daldinia caldariorum]|uniref:uncharacterized protein n=1 Tax=Daldinia caldariorum TaxID=326644 RepID=UPI0020072A0A|nr:uncharacterized protein F4812DRAFT_470407 [Daldinia caldariorum]KAI1469458.1 hypothetical protein F4812DRAFT_470407 [Daldinia caldariorum]